LVLIPVADKKPAPDTLLLSHKYVLVELPPNIVPPINVVLVPSQIVIAEPAVLFKWSIGVFTVIVPCW